MRSQRGLQINCLEVGDTGTRDYVQSLGKAQLLDCHRFDVVPTTFGRNLRLHDLPQQGKAVYLHFASQM